MTNEVRGFDLSKLWLRKSFRGLSRVAETSLHMVERCHFEKSDIPLLASPRGGVAASPRKWREASLLTPPGWCSLSHRSEHHPVLAKRMLRDIFLIARPPLLGVMRGGDFAFSKMVPNFDSFASEGGDASVPNEGVAQANFLCKAEAFNLALRPLKLHTFS